MLFYCNCYADLVISRDFMSYSQMISMRNMIKRSQFLRSSSVFGIDACLGKFGFEFRILSRLFICNVYGIKSYLMWKCKTRSKIKHKQLHRRDICLDECLAGNPSTGHLYEIGGTKFDLHWKSPTSLKAMKCLPPKQHAFVIFRLNVMSVWKCGLGAQCTLYKVYITSHQTAAYTV